METNELRPANLRKGLTLSLSSEKGKAAWLFLLFLIIAGLVGTGYLYRDRLEGTRLGELLSLDKKAKPKVVYYCPMHPDYKSDKPGTCPICNMNLEKLEPEKGASAAPSGKTAKPKVIYYCPMHPDYKSDKPGTCPICNMNLEKLEPEKEPAQEGRKILYWVDPMNPSHKSDKPGKAPDGMDLVPVYEERSTAAGARPPGTVKISPEKQQLIGVQYGVVLEKPLSKTIRAAGRVVYDETRIARIQPKVEGWIDRVYVDFTGKLLKKGQPLISVYSPDLLSTQQELLIAKKSKDILEKSEFGEVGANAVSLYAATRERLRLWNISDQQIREIEKRGTPSTTLILHSPMDGFVITRNAFSGQRITPETELYSIADLRTVWVMAEIYEYEIPMIRLGQPAVMDLSYFPGKSYKGKVTYIYPELDKVTRTLKVRLEYPNPEFELKPDMFANIQLKIDYGKKLALPEDAVLDSGSEQIVFVALEGGYFEPRTVTLGEKVGNFYIVADGIKSGERVVTSANFLIDSESKLKAALGGMGGGAHGGHDSGPSAEGEEKTNAPAEGQEPHPAGQADHSHHR